MREHFRTTHLPAPTTKFSAPPEAEVVQGSQSYLDTLAAVHGCFQPDVYLEIGVRHGVSLALANRSRIVVGVDPAPANTGITAISK